MKETFHDCNDLLILEVIYEMHMRKYQSIVACFFLLVVAISCKKEEKTSSCFDNSSSVRLITNKRAIIKVGATINPVYIVEEGTIDHILIPCNLPQEFFQNNLQVIISGEVKATPPGPGPCCSNNFVISSISR